MKWVKRECVAAGTNGETERLTCGYGDRLVADCTGQRTYWGVDDLSRVAALFSDPVREFDRRFGLWDFEEAPVSDGVWWTGKTKNGVEVRIASFFARIFLCEEVLNG